MPPVSIYFLCICSWPPYLWDTPYGILHCAVFRVLHVQCHVPFQIQLTDHEYRPVFENIFILYLRIVLLHKLTNAKHVVWIPGSFLYTKSTYIAELFILHVWQLKCTINKLPFHVCTNYDICVIFIIEISGVTAAVTTTVSIPEYRPLKIKRCALPTLHPPARLQNSRCKFTEVVAQPLQKCYRKSVAKT